MSNALPLYKNKGGCWEPQSLNVSVYGIYLYMGHFESLAENKYAYEEWNFTILRNDLGAVRRVVLKVYTQLKDTKVPSNQIQGSFWNSKHSVEIPDRSHLNSKITWTLEKRKVLIVPEKQKA